MSFYGEDILIRRKVSFPASIISSDNAWIIVFAPKSVNLDTESWSQFVSTEEPNNRQVAKV